MAGVLSLNSYDGSGDESSPEHSTALGSLVGIGGYGDDDEDISDGGGGAVIIPALSRPPSPPPSQPKECTVFPC